MDRLERRIRQTKKEIQSLLERVPAEVFPIHSVEHLGVLQAARVAILDFTPSERRAVLLMPEPVGLVTAAGIRHTVAVGPFPPDGVQRSETLLIHDQRPGTDEDYWWYGWRAAMFLKEKLSTSVSETVLSPALP